MSTNPSKREQLARVLFCQMNMPTGMDWNTQTPATKEEYALCVDAILAELREPDDRQIDAYAKRHPMIGHPNRLADHDRRKKYDEGVKRAAIANWQAMIDAIE